jgi:hypothetical protein
VVLKYRDKEYNSEDVPLFLMFKTLTHKKKFINSIASHKLKTYFNTKDIQVALAGNTCLKDKRTKFYIRIDIKEEKNIISKCMFLDENTDNNSIVCAPYDIPETVIGNWIENNLQKLIN